MERLKGRRLGLVGLDSSLGSDWEMVKETETEGSKVKEMEKELENQRVKQNQRGKESDSKMEMREEFERDLRFQKESKFLCSKGSWMMKESQWVRSSMREEERKIWWESWWKKLIEWLRVFERPLKLISIPLLSLKASQTSTK